MTNRQEMARKLAEDPRLGALVALIGLTDGGDGKVYNPKVDRTGDKIILPENANLPEVIETLQRQYELEEQRTQIHVTMQVPPWDGAIALKKAIESNLGVFNQREGFGGAHQIDVEVELGKTIQVPWGTFELPGMEGAQVETDTAFEEGRVVFRCHVICKRKYEARVRRLLDTVRDNAVKESLHRGKAFSIAFHDEDGDPINMPKPKFFPIHGEEPIFRADLTAAIERNVFVPILHADTLLEEGEQLKRGILFAGNYGVGKTLLASHIARVAIKAGWTFIYVKDSEELPEALRYAQQYEPVVVFAEDVDRVAGPHRTNEVNELLNQLDGIDSKSAKIMTILTSNHPDQINEAMRRPGRIDLVLEVLPPDDDTVERMIREFSNGKLDPTTDLSEVSQILAGEAPARVREAVSRAKLESLRRTGEAKAKITGEDLAAVARDVKAEVDLFRRNKEDDNGHVSVMADGFAAVATTLRKSVNGHEQRVRA